MRAANNPGRVAGLWYLLLIVLGPLRLIYIPNKLFVEIALTLWLLIRDAKPQEVP